MWSFCGFKLNLRKALPVFVKGFWLKWMSPLVFHNLEYMKVLYLRADKHRYRNSPVVLLWFVFSGMSHRIILNGIVFLKMKLLSSFTHTRVVPNLYDFLSSEDHGWRCFFKTWRRFLFKCGTIFSLLGELLPKYFTLNKYVEIGVEIP